MQDEKGDIEKILEERQKLDSMLQSRFSRQVTVMFTDIKGSTTFYEIRGDIDGRAMVHRHNAVVLPAIKENNGVVLKTIGDATMSVYDEPSDGLRAAMEIQKRLREYNRGREEKEQIHVRIGLNYGTGLVEKGDVYGDVVNVASRIESLADADEILIPEDLYRRVKSSDDFIFRYVETAEVKGKKQPLKVYRLVWHEESICMGQTRKAGETSAAHEGLFVIEASLSGQKLKVSGFEKTEGEEMTVKGYEEVSYKEGSIETYTKGIVDLLNRANRRGKIGNDLFIKLEEYGRLLFDELIPVQIRERLAKTEKKHLMISIDDKLVHIPWELLFDGGDFLCLRFNVGRTVRTRQQVAVSRRMVGRPVKMQILADPRGDLLGSYNEGIRIKDDVGSFDDWIDVTSKTTDIKTDYVKAKIRNFDVVHFAGHAEHDALRPEESGWMLKDGKLSAQQVMNMTGIMPMPSLVFSNACQTGQTDEWRLDDNYEDRIFGLANAFLLSGVQHYIGTFWEIPDEAASHFALHFYTNLFRGVPVGEAVRQARVFLTERYGRDVIIWAGYMLYGDPTMTYIRDAAEPAKAETEAAQSPVRESPASPDLRHPEELIQFPHQKKSSLRTALAGAGLAAAVLLAALFFFWKGGDERDTDTHALQKQATAVVKNDSAERIDELVTSLAEKYREDQYEKGEAVSDEWTTPPLTMVIMDITSTGSADPAGREKFIQMLNLSLQEERRVHMVERALLLKLLEELRLSSSDLADPATSLKIGKVLSARIIVTGSIIADRREQMVILRFIDTETTEVKKALSFSFRSGEMSTEFIDGISGTIVRWINDEIPLQGRIISVLDDKLRLNIGEMHGLKKGDRLDILEEIPKGSGIYTATGEIEISETGREQSLAVFAGRLTSADEGDRVRWKQ